jgi:hypothetical protein
MEAIYSFEISVDFQRTAGMYVPEDRPPEKYERADKKKTSYGIGKKMYLLYIFPPELDTIMTSLF